MIVTTHLTVHYDDETRLAQVYTKTCWSLLGCDGSHTTGALVAEGLRRVEMVGVLRALAGSIARDHQECDDTPKAIGR